MKRNFFSTYVLSLRIVFIVAVVVVVLFTIDYFQTREQEAAEWPPPDLTEQHMTARFSKGELIKLSDIEPIACVMYGAWYDAFLSESGEECAFVKMDIEIEVIARIGATDEQKDIPIP